MNPSSRVRNGANMDCKNRRDSVKMSTGYSRNTRLRRNTHQILANKDAHEDGESDATDEPEETERVQILGLAVAAVLSRLLTGQLPAQLHGIVEAGQILLQTPARRGRELVGRQIAARPLPKPSGHVLLTHSITGVPVGRLGAAPAGLGRMRRESLSGAGPGLVPLQIQVESRLQDASGCFTNANTNRERPYSFIFM